MIKSFYTTVLMKDPRFKSPSACYDPALLFPPFRAVVEKIIVGAAAMGHTLHIGETFRSQARQFALYQKGLTQLAHVGVHGFGLACDFSLIDPGGDYDPVGAHYEFLVSLCTANPCPWGPTVSGCSWIHPDYDHVQGVLVSDQARLFAGTWYPG